MRPDGLTARALLHIYQAGSQQNPARRLWTRYNLLDLSGLGEHDGESGALAGRAADIQRAAPLLHDGLDEV